MFLNNFVCLTTCLKKLCLASNVWSKTSQWGRPALSFLDNAPERVPDLEILLCISVCALRFYTLNMPQTLQSGQVPQQALQYLSSLESLSKLAHLQGSIAQSETVITLTNTNSRVHCHQLFCDIQNYVAPNEGDFFCRSTCTESF